MYQPYDMRDPIYISWQSFLYGLFDILNLRELTLLSLVFHNLIHLVAQDSSNTEGRSSLSGPDPYCINLHISFIVLSWYLLSFLTHDSKSESPTELPYLIQQKPYLVFLPEQIL